MDNMNKVFLNFVEMLIFVVVFIICGIGVIIGLFNGFVIVYLNVILFIVIMGIMIIIYGINLFYYDVVGLLFIVGFSENFLDFV